MGKIGLPSLPIRQHGGLSGLLFLTMNIILLWSCCAGPHRYVEWDDHRLEREDCGCYMAVYLQPQREYHYHYHYHYHNHNQQYLKAEALIGLEESARGLNLLDPSAAEYRQPRNHQRHHYEHDLSFPQEHGGLKRSSSIARSKSVSLLESTTSVVSMLAVIAITRASATAVVAAIASMATIGNPLPCVLVSAAGVSQPGPPSSNNRKSLSAHKGSASSQQGHEEQQRESSNLEAVYMDSEATSEYRYHNQMYIRNNDEPEDVDNDHEDNHNYNYDPGVASNAHRGEFESERDYKHTKFVSDDPCLVDPSSPACSIYEDDREQRLAVIEKQESPETQPHNWITIHGETQFISDTRIMHQRYSLSDGHSDMFQGASLKRRPGLFKDNHAHLTNLVTYPFILPSPHMVQLYNRSETLLDLERNMQPSGECSTDSSAQTVLVVIGYHTFRSTKNMHSMLHYTASLRASQLASLTFVVPEHAVEIVRRWFLSDTGGMKNVRVHGYSIVRQQEQDLEHTQVSKISSAQEYFPAGSHTGAQFTIRPRRSLLARLIYFLLTAASKLVSVDPVVYSLNQLYEVIHELSHVAKENELASKAVYGVLHCHGLLPEKAKASMIYHISCERIDESYRNGNVGGQTYADFDYILADTSAFAASDAANLLKIPLVLVNPSMTESSPIFATSEISMPSCQGTILNIFTSSIFSLVSPLFSTFFATDSPMPAGVEVEVNLRTDISSIRVSAASAKCMDAPVSDTKPIFRESIPFPKGIPDAKLSKSKITGLYDFAPLKIIDSCKVYRSSVVTRALQVLTRFCSWLFTRGSLFTRNLSRQRWFKLQPLQSMFDADVWNPFLLLSETSSAFVRVPKLHQYALMDHYGPFINILEDCGINISSKEGNQPKSRSNDDLDGIHHHGLPKCSSFFHGASVKLRSLIAKELSESKRSNYPKHSHSLVLHVSGEMGDSFVHAIHSSCFFQSSAWAAHSVRVPIVVMAPPGSSCACESRISAAGINNGVEHKPASHSCDRCFPDSHTLPGVNDSLGNTYILYAKELMLEECKKAPGMCFDDLMMRASLFASSLYASLQYDSIMVSRCSQFEVNAVLSGLKFQRLTRPIICVPSTWEEREMAAALERQGAAIVLRGLHDNRDLHSARNDFRVDSDMKHYFQIREALSPKSPEEFAMAERLAQSSSKYFDALSTCPNKFVDALISAVLYAEEAKGVSGIRRLLEYYASSQNANGIRRALRDSSWFIRRLSPLLARHHRRSIKKCSLVYERHSRSIVGALGRFGRRVQNGMRARYESFRERLLYSYVVSTMSPSSYRFAGSKSCAAESVSVEQASTGAPCIGEDSDGNRDTVGVTPSWSWIFISSVLDYTAMLELFIPLSLWLALLFMMVVVKSWNVKKHLD